jgi:folate-binding protein YgfZ
VGLIRLEGAGGRRFLHGQSSQAIDLAPEGACLATCLISPTARMRGLALVRLEADGSAELAVLAGDAAAVHQALDRVLFPADGVRLGPVQPAQLVRWVGDPAPADAEGNPNLLQPGVELGAGAGQPAWLQRDGEPLPTWLQALAELSAEQVEQRRLRSGFPAAPGELNDDTNPFELGLAPWVSLNKGCYVGQETLAKLATYDGVKQQLRHWRAERTGPAAADACAPGTTLTSAAGERAGVITSTLDGPDGLEGLALVRRPALTETQLLSGPELPLQISRPSGFVDPPVGAGGSGSGGSPGVR